MTASPTAAGSTRPTRGAQRVRPTRASNCRSRLHLSTARGDQGHRVGEQPVFAACTAMVHSPYPV